MDKNEPAFPSNKPNEHQTGFYIHQNGLTIRDYFAAKALNGMLNDYDWETERFVIKLAKSAYQIADAMLEARGK